MFVFKPYDDIDVKGIDRDGLPEDMKCLFHFSVHCDGLEELDGVVFVRFGENYIQFLRENEEVSDAERPKVVESILLTNPKDTGYDLLYFAENVKKNDIIGKEILKKSRDKLEGFLDRAEQIFKGFPFFSDKKNIRGRKKGYNYDRVFMRLCLLEFLLAIDTHDEIFAIDPGYEMIRKKLRDSKVYCLLCAKLRYCMYHYKGREVLNSEESTFVTSKYANLLMDSDYNKMVPPEYFEEQRFLYNPEYELMRIMKGKDSVILEKRVRQK